MTNVPFTTIEKFPDIETQNIYKERLQAGMESEEILKAIRKKARDNARTPMQWNTEENAGFTIGTPWYEVNPNYREINAEEAVGRETSVFIIIRNSFVSEERMKSWFMVNMNCFFRRTKIFIVIREHWGEDSG